MKILSRIGVTLLLKYFPNINRDVVIACGDSHSIIFYLVFLISYLNAINRESCSRASFFRYKIQNPLSESKVMIISRFIKILKNRHICLITVNFRVPTSDPGSLTHRLIDNMRLNKLSGDGGEYCVTWRPVCTL